MLGSLLAALKLLSTAVIYLRKILYWLFIERQAAKIALESSGDISTKYALDNYRRSTISIVTYAVEYLDGDLEKASVTNR